MLWQGNADDRGIGLAIKRKVALCLAVSAIFLFLQSGFTEELTFKAEVDKAELSADEMLTYKLTISSTLNNIPEPMFPDFSGFNVFSRAITSKVSVSRGTKSVCLGYIFMLRPTAAGIFTIKPAELKIGDKTYSSAEFKIKVKPSGVKPGLTPKPAPKNASPDNKNEEAHGDGGSPLPGNYPQVTL